MKFRGITILSLAIGSVVILAGCEAPHGGHYNNAPEFYDSSYYHSDSYIGQ